MKPLKTIPGCQLHCWNHCDSEVKNFMGIYITKNYFDEFQRCQWHRWNLYYTSEISNRLYGYVSSFKGKIKQKYSNVKYPHTILYEYFKQKVGDFGFSGVIDTAETDFDDCGSNISRPYAKRFQPVNQGPRWGWLMKKSQRSISSGLCPFNHLHYTLTKSLKCAEKFSMRKVTLLVCCSLPFALFCPSTEEQGPARCMIL
jgi:hypothetical protein